MEEPTEKRCSKCGEVKAMKDFYLVAKSDSRRRSQCKQCMRRAHEAYKTANPGVIRASKAAWDKKNRARIVERRHARYAASPDLLDAQRENVRRWIAAHPEAMAEHARKKRAKRAEAMTGPVDPEALWTGFCALCEADLDADLRWPDPLSKSLDHIVPLSKGGSYTQDNLQWTHLFCNTQKGARVPD